MTRRLRWCGGNRNQHSVFAWNRDTAVPAEGNGDLQTLIRVLVARPRWCLTLSNPVSWQNWMASYLGYTLWMTTLFRGWPIMVHEMHTRRRRRLLRLGSCVSITDSSLLWQTTGHSYLICRPVSEPYVVSAPLLRLLFCLSICLWHTQLFSHDRASEQSYKLSDKNTSSMWRGVR